MDGRATAAYRTGPKELRRLGLNYEAAMIRKVHKLLDLLARAGDEEARLPPTPDRVDALWLVAASGDEREFRRRLRRDGPQAALDFADAEFVHPGLQDKRRERRAQLEYEFTYGTPKPERRPDMVWALVGFILAFLISTAFKGANDADGSF